MLLLLLGMMPCMMLPQHAPRIACLVITSAPEVWRHDVNEVSGKVKFRSDRLDCKCSQHMAVIAGFLFIYNIDLKRCLHCHADMLRGTQVRDLSTCDVMRLLMLP
jgi:hypothetical protein